MVDQVQELLFRADFFIDCYGQLRTAYLKNMPTDYVAKIQYCDLSLAKLTVLNANLNFFESVSCLASLLRDIKSDPKRDEISFFMLADRLSGNVKDVFLTKLKSVFVEYESSGIKNMRDKFVDHKDPKLSGDPAAAFINFRAKELVDSCLRLINMLKEMYREYFPERFSNNYFSDYYSDGMTEFIKLLNDRLHI